MKVLKNKSGKIKVPPNSRVPIITPDHCFNHHALMVLCGRRGSGKSVFACNYLKMLKSHDKADRIIMVSSTVASNMALLESLGVNLDEDVLDPEDPAVMDKLHDIVDMERDEYVDDLEKIRKWKELQKLLKSKVPIDDIDDHLLLEFSDELGNLEEPKLKYGHRPFIHVFFDDVQGSNLFRNRKFMNTMIKHRHLSGMPYDPKTDKELAGAIGISVYIAIQSFKAQGGLQRSVRNNATVLVMIGKTKDKEELQEIYDSVSGEVTYEQFMDGYEYATNKPHGSFVMDFFPKCSMKRFRCNMDEFLVMDGVECECGKK